MEEKEAQQTSIVRQGALRKQRLWVVRHGETFWNAEQRFCGSSDIDLSLKGQKQALWAAEQLKDQSLTALYASDLVRARRTAELIAQHQPEPLVVQTLPAWREISFGDWEGMTYDQITERYGEPRAFFTDRLNAVPPNGEAFADFAQRIQTVFRELLHSRKEQQGDLALVCHGGVVRVLVCLVLKIPFERQWQFRVDNASLTAIDFYPDGVDPIASASLIVSNYHSGLLDKSDQS
ncbi:histidine phosphatase family protein [Tengunoibacter tsumagoiensis]|uniref:phosphoglycerate mutase (2,3-diphosphoglycerate-dependent) n=1 Tax=Tengunoibacter tsumagoiensis TaxID=2014871 RepID=A0A401ZYN7_9CHLR|nr:histidine phosphatase family protein [Tengunoibacter tsumagoiensis]GCE11978.1 alpha-ribazole phosphatase [Tengunoibacter tsumagoiensis]